MRAVEEADAGNARASRRDRGLEQGLGLRRTARRRQQRETDRRRIGLHRRAGRGWRQLAVQNRETRGRKRANDPVVDRLAGAGEVVDPGTVADEGFGRRRDFGHHFDAAVGLHDQMVVAVGFVLDRDNAGGDPPDRDFRDAVRILLRSGGSCVATSRPGGRGRLISSSSVASTMPAPRFSPSITFLPTLARSGS